MTFMITFLLAGVPGTPAAFPTSCSSRRPARPSTGRRETSRARVSTGADRKVRLESGTPLRPLVVLLDLARERGFQLDARAKTATALDMGALAAESNLGFALAGDVMGADEPDSLRTVPASRAPL